MAAEAHSASDAYLKLSVPDGKPVGHVVMAGQWDLALRDLDFVLKLDDDGDGRLTWEEVRRHQAAIQQYAFAHLHFYGGPGNPCELRPTRQMIDNHADGAYVALFFDVACVPAPTKLSLDYTIFFAIDPSHRGILVMNKGAEVSTAVLSPEGAKIELTL